MTKLLYGAPVVDQLFTKTKQVIDENKIQGYLAVFMFGDNHPGAAYVQRKTVYAEKLGLTTKVFTNTDNIYADIEKCNTDSACLGIIIQLPLPATLEDQKKAILDAVHPAKDPDCLGEKLLSLSLVGSGEVDIIPATPAAVIHILEYYDYNIKHHTYRISMLGQSDLIGKPLTKILTHYGSNIDIFDEFSDQQQMRDMCKLSDIIIAATGKLHLVDDSFIRDDQLQVLIDVGRGLIDGKPAGDINADSVIGKIAALTPVPGGVGPVTVASLFWNMISLRTLRDIFKN